MDRRQFLRLAGTVAAGASLSACSPLYRRLSDLPGSHQGWPRLTPTEIRTLNRLTFGPLPAERWRVHQIGLGEWIEEQLDPGSMDDGGLAWRLRPFEALRLDAAALTAWEAEDVILQLKQGALLRQVYSRRQLKERMVEFWTDHFNVSVRKGDCWFLKPVEDRQVIRPHALGDFRELLWASAHSPAMLVYLDNQANHWEAPNENYARELLELHTLGVEAGYSQRDVMELARCLTGWTVKKHFWAGEFRFDPERHDPDAKQLLGLQVDPAGQAEAEQVLDRIAEHPATGRRLAQKLVRRFVSEAQDRPAAELAERAARAFHQHGGSIQAVLRVVMLDGLAANPAAWGPKIKRPADVVASALRLLGADTDGGAPLQEALQAMGQPPFEWPSPDGPPEDSAFWTTNLLPRWNFAIQLAQDELEGTRLDLPGWAESNGVADLPSALDALGELLLGTALESAPRESLLAALDIQRTQGLSARLPLLAAGLLASPGFQWR